MAEYIERDALIAELAKGTIITDDIYGMGIMTGLGHALTVVREIPAADVVEVVPELRKTVELLHDEYEKAKQNPIVHDPLAYAVYQVWKAVDGRRKNGR
jgi:hypothetical protein